MRRCILVFILLFLLTLSSILSGCDGMIKSNDVYFYSIYTGEKINLRVSADKYLQGEWELGRAFYHTKCSEVDVLKEIANNEGVKIIELCGYKFFTIADEAGIYNISILPSQRKGYKSVVTIDDMRYKFIENDSIDLDCYFPFPYFVFEGAIEMNKELVIQKDNFLELIKGLGIYTIVEQKDQLSLTFKNLTLNVDYTEKGIIISEIAKKTVTM